MRRLSLHGCWWMYVAMWLYVTVGLLVIGISHATEDIGVCPSGDLYGCHCVTGHTQDAKWTSDQLEHLPSALHCDNVDFSRFDGIPENLPPVLTAHFKNIDGLKVTRLPETFRHTVLLNFSRNVITEIQPGAFQNMKSLNHLYMQNNSIMFKTLTQDTFTGLDKLTYMDLSDNKNLVKVDPGVFSQKSLPKVLEIIMSNCGLLDISDGAFENVTTLTHLGLSHNRLSHVPMLSSVPLRHLNHLDLSYNRIETLRNLHNMPSLTQLLLSHNNLTHIAGDAFAAVSSRLRLLVLSHNQLLTIQPAAFLTLFNLTELNLEHNHLTHLLWEELPWHDSIHHASLERITLYGNRWQCDCDNAYLVEGSFVDIYNKGNHMLRCWTPKKLRGKLMKQVPEKYFLCNEQHPHSNKKAIIVLYVLTSVLLLVFGAVIFRKMRNWKQHKTVKNNMYTKFYNRSTGNETVEHF